MNQKQTKSQRSTKYRIDSTVSHSHGVFIKKMGHNVREHKRKRNMKMFLFGNRFGNRNTEQRLSAPSISNRRNHKPRFRGCFSLNPGICIYSSSPPASPTSPPSASALSSITSFSASASAGASATGSASASTGVSASASAAGASSAGASSEGLAGASSS